MKTKYKRPATLSDPCHDFTHEILREMLAKNDADLRWNDFQNLLGPFLPAGTYEEVAYFLPLAFDYIKANEEDALDLVTALFGFCSKNIDRLGEDGLAEITRVKVLECLNDWSRHFEVIHYDKQGCEAKGWGIDYFDHVKNSEVICQATSDLVEFGSFQDVAVSFVESLAYHGDNPTKASWFLEYSCARFAVYTPPSITEITSLLTDKDLLSSAYAAVLPTLIEEEASSTYWRDTLNKLGI